MLLPLAVVTALILPIPTPRPEPRDIRAERLAAHILRVYPKAPYARELADAILTNAMVHGLDPALLSAIAWTESGYRSWVRGADGEVGLWQHLCGGWLARPWEEIRGHRPPWRRLSRKTRRRHCADLQTGTHFAAWLLSYHLQWCGDHTARCYAQYNSGRPQVSLRYVRLIRRRSGAVRMRLRGQ